MERIRRISLILTLGMAVLCGSCGRRKASRPDAPAEPAANGSMARIVSLAPSITETLFALGLGDRVAGVTRFCRYPPEAAAKTDVGGFLDPNYEAIVALDPDLVVVVEPHEQARRYLSNLGIRHATVDHASVGGILMSIIELGRLAGVEPRATELAGDIRARMRAVEARTANLPKPSVLLSAGRDLTSLNQVFLAGAGNFYASLLTLAGGRNAYEGPLGVPAVSIESLLAMNPDVIIEIVDEPARLPLAPADIVRQWHAALPEVTAVRSNRVHVIAGDYAMIPGPRFIRVLEEFAQLLHPAAMHDPLENAQP